MLEANDFDRVKSNRFDHCESESYRISEIAIEITQMDADCANEYVWLYFIVCDDVRDGVLRNTLKIFIECVLRWEKKKNKKISTKKLGSSTQWNLMNVIETMRHHFVQNTVKNDVHIMLCLMLQKVVCSATFWMKDVFICSMLNKSDFILL